MAAEGEKPTASAINSNNHEFMVPKKEIGPGPDDIPKWEKSEAYRDLIGFLLAMNDAVKGKKISDARVFSPEAPGLVRDLLGPKHADAAEEVSTYLVEGVGNQTRIDYGTGWSLLDHRVKTGPFAEHSNQLWNISAVPHWEKVNSGLVKMYKAEVLAKFPVIQHFLFGSLLRINPTS
ncbi:PTPA-like protein [Mya arenaria]|uniref:Serine/threonine-protein phosphatase 2A activator n=1 Tax=Mya arenaria TaxID=6604 RepID=A0ABY7GAK7_MYAAR|nr:PTPA-like protein [Mya arenaria]